MKLCIIDKHTETVSFSEYTVFPSFSLSSASFQYNSMTSIMNTSSTDNGYSTTTTINNNNGEGRVVEELDEEKEGAVLLNMFSIDQMAVGENADCSTDASPK